MVQEKSQPLSLARFSQTLTGLKQNSTIVLVPSSAIETMQLGGLAGLTELTIGIGQEKKMAKAHL